ncbi:3-oxoacyl-[acyl-carrier-protein] synthase III C-terminal domain-containing protein [Micromonospora sp. AKA38]|uniref:3-oxoacyl-[acyl-carrier-protein] synthase III C-terminal domain-containing protein n=1 Tax=Micromonospora sp. AKA38 TaxID=2733861 RepID=UPI0022BB9635|nr:3-oxoacyl-[acyl-carrier-protein] synthase III C-terminal domain-containing protein [Micromonospora sp. AKA38]GHJ15477.1 3-oxoacyl-ACP synthase [Micromonospora sp. AKA38]
MSFGLVSFGEALGDPAPVADVVGEYTDDVQRVLGYGYRQVHRAAPAVGVTDLAERAARRALDAAALPAAELDLLVLAVTDVTEHLYWDAAAELAHRLGLVDAEAVLLTQACTTGVLSLDTVAGRFATHPGYATALVVAANRTCEAYWNRMDTQPMVFSDGAVATVARRGHPRLRWLATEAVTDGRYAGFHRLDSGGAATPFGPGGDPPAALDGWHVMEFFDYDAEQFAQFARELDERAVRVTERACARAGVAVADLARLILVGDNERAMASLAEAHGVPLARTNRELAAEHGHLGAADQLFGLSRLLAAGELVEGDRVALISLGRGMHWACTIVAV